MDVHVQYFVLVSLSVFALGYCDPLVLTVDDFQSSIDSGKPYFVKFYAPWCGHCKHLAPTWDKLADHFHGTNVHIAKVDCTVETKVCADQEVKGYPTLKLFSGSTVSGHRGARDIDSLVEFVTTTVGSPQEELQDEDAGGPVQLTDTTFDSYITSNPGVHFIKFYAPWCGHCQHLAPTWNDLALHFQDEQSVHISKVDCTEETTTCQLQEVKGYPTLLVFINGLVVERYSGSRDLENLVQFVSDISAREAPPVRGVEVLTADTFSDAVTQNGHVFVKFFAPWCGHCKSLAPTWDKLAEAVHSSSSDSVIAKVDCTAERDVCSDQQVHGYPTLVLFREGERKEYRGPRDFDSLLHFFHENS